MKRSARSGGMQIGEKRGELKKAKNIAISLAQEGESIERIAIYLRIPDSSSSIHLSVLKLLSKNLTITP